MSSELTKSPAGNGTLALNTTTPVPEATLARFPAIDPDSEILELMAENLDEGESLGIGNLTKVGNPSGKSLSFLLPNPEGGKDRTVDELTGIVLGWQSGRIYYESSDATEGTPPDCSSRDGVHGFGDFAEGSEANPSGLCEGCPMSKWVRTEDDSADVPSPCKPMTNVLLLTEEEALPLLLRVPRTSITAFDKYRKGLLRYNTGLARSLVKITLEREKNPQGTEYARMEFNLGEKLPGDRAEVKATSEAVMTFGSVMKEIITAPPTRQTGGAIAATAERGIIESGGVSFGEPVDEQPTADDLAELDARDAETSSAAAS